MFLLYLLSWLLSTIYYFFKLMILVPEIAGQFFKTKGQLVIFVILHFDMLHQHLKELVFLVIYIFRNLFASFFYLRPDIVLFMRFDGLLLCFLDLFDPRKRSIADHFASFS